MVSPQAVYVFRQATNADYHFLFDLHRSTMREYIEPLWGWNEEWQSEYFQKKFNAADRQIIVVDGRNAGVVVVEERADEIYLSLIELLPEYQGRGIGSSIIGELKEQAQSQAIPLRLHVLRSNVPAQLLYARLGFRVIEESEYRYRMEFRSATESMKNILASQHAASR